MRLLVDMNLSPDWTGHLSAAGLEAVFWADVGPVDADDAYIMDYARQHEFAILTSDLDFGEMLALNKSTGPSVIQLRGGDTLSQASIQTVCGALERFREQIVGGALVTISLSRARIRILPIVAIDQ